MPRKYAKRSNNKKPKAKAKKGRRLMSHSEYNAKMQQYGYDAATDTMGYSKPKSKPSLRGNNPSYGRTRGRRGASAVNPDAASGAVVGHVVGKRKRMATVLAKRKASILSVLADTRFPVIKDHILGTATQLDWTGGQQACQMYEVGYLTGEIEAMLTQSNSAHYVSTASLVAPAVDSLTNQRMDVYDKVTKYNFKNTCSHTVYMEIRAYNCKGYHSFNMRETWSDALTQDNMVQNQGSFGTQEGVFDIGARPDFRQPELNQRWTQRKDATYMCALEPGQETSYTYVHPGFRFDKQKFNVLVGSAATPTDVNYGPFTAQLLVFCRAEMVADALDTDVNYGSGHIAVNCDVQKSWAAVPYVKPLQASFTNQWGTVIEANELDINQYTAASATYSEQV